MRKMLISIIFGLLCLTFSFYHLNLNIANHESMSFVWSFIFPTLIIAWGKKYGVIFVSTLTLSYLCFAIIIFIERFIISDMQPFPDEKEYIALIILTTMSIATAGIIIRYTQRHLKIRAGIARQEVQYRNIFENMNDIYYELDQKGTILVISPSVKDILGYASEDLIGKNMAILHKDPNQQKQLVASLYKDRKLENYKVISQDVHGRDRTICISSKVIVNTQGQISIIGTGKDVTDYLEAKKVQQETEEKYKMLAEKMMAAFIVLTPIRDENNQIIDYLITDANPSVYNHIKVHHYDLIGLNLGQFDIEEVISYGKFASILQEGKNLTYEIFSQKLKLYFNINAFKISEQEIGIIFNNISPYKNAIFKIEELNEDLEKRVFERTEELHNAINELEVFSYTITHDLKSPLRAIEAYSSIILEDYAKSLDPAIVESMNCIQDLCRDTFEMINKLLEYSVTTNAPLVKEIIDMHSVFMSVYSNYKSIHPNRALELKIQANLPQVMGDKILMKQVIDNILSNAIKFTKTREKAIIEVGFENKGQRYLFFVKDNGVGFDMSYSGKVFGIFERLHSVEEFEGSGIGLATVQKIIHRHGGETMIKGRVDEGATLFFTLPQG